MKLKLYIYIYIYIPIHRHVCCRNITILTRHNLFSISHPSHHFAISFFSHIYTFKSTLCTFGENYLIITSYIYIRFSLLIWKQTPSHSLSIATNIMGRKKCDITCLGHNEYSFCVSLQMLCHYSKYHVHISIWFMYTLVVRQRVRQNL